MEGHSSACRDLLKYIGTTDEVYILICCLLSSSQRPPIFVLLDKKGLIASCQSINICQSKYQMLSAAIHSCTTRPTLFVCVLISQTNKWSMVLFPTYSYALHKPSLPFSWYPVIVGYSLIQGRCFLITLSWGSNCKHFAYCLFAVLI